MSASTVWLSFIEFKDSPLPGFSPEAKDYTFGYYWWQEGVEEHEGFRQNIWKSAQERDEYIESVGGLLAFIQQDDGDLLEAIRDAIDTDARDPYDPVPDRTPRCTLWVNGTALSVTQIAGHLVELKRS